MESKFYIGQKIVAITTHPDGDFKKGDIFIVLAVKKGCCHWEVKINHNTELYLMVCNCGKEEESTPFYFQHCFSPIQEQEISSMTYEDAIELVTEKELVP